MSLTALIGGVAIPALSPRRVRQNRLEGRVGYTYGTMIKRFCAIGWVLTGVTFAAMAAKPLIAPRVHRLVQCELAFGLAVQIFSQPAFSV